MHVSYKKLQPYTNLLKILICASRLLQDFNNFSRSNENHSILIFFLFILSSVSSIVWREMFISPWKFVFQECLLSFLMTHVWWTNQVEGRGNRVSDWVSIPPAYYSRLPNHFKCGFYPILCYFYCKMFCNVAKFFYFLPVPCSHPLFSSHNQNWRYDLSVVHVCTLFVCDHNFKVKGKLLLLPGNLVWK